MSGKQPDILHMVRDYHQQHDTWPTRNDLDTLHPEYSTFDLGCAIRQLVSDGVLESTAQQNARGGGRVSGYGWKIWQLVPLEKVADEQLKAG